MAGLTELRAAAKTSKDAARHRAEQARRDAELAKRLRANPVPQYVEMPEPTGNAEVDSEKDLGELEQGFRRRAADEGRRFALVTDSEFWGAICFRSRSQKDAFFAALGVLDLGIEERYFDGVAMAQRLGIDLPEEPAPKPLRQPDPTWIEFVKE